MEKTGDSFFQKYQILTDYYAYLDNKIQYEANITKSLTSIQNGLGASILDNFEYGEVVVDTGSIETTYKVYVYAITNGAKVEFKNVIVE